MREVVLDAEAAAEVKLRRLAPIPGVGRRCFVIRIGQIKQAMQMRAERDVLQRGRCAMIPNGAIRQHPRIDREIPHAAVLAVIAIHANLKPPFQMIDTNEFARDGMRGAFRRKLAIDELIPSKSVALVFTLGLLCRFGIDGAIGIGAERGLVLGAQKRDSGEETKAGEE